MNLDDDLGIVLGHGDADPPLAGRRCGRVEGVVHEVSEQCDQVLAVERAARHDRVVADAKLDSSLRRQRGFGQQECSEDGIANPLE